MGTLLPLVLKLLLCECGLQSVQFHLENGDVHLGFHEGTPQFFVLLQDTEHYILVFRLSGFISILWVKTIMCNPNIFEGHCKKSQFNIIKVEMTQKAN